MLNNVTEGYIYKNLSLRGTKQPAKGSSLIPLKNKDTASIIPTIQGE